MFHGFAERDRSLSQAVRDLPDPLDPSPSLSTSDPDDLLSKMADEAIDRLIADADSGRPMTPLRTPAVDPTRSPTPELVTTQDSAATEPDEVEDEEPAYPPGADTEASTADNRIVAVEETSTDFAVDETEPQKTRAEVEAEHHSPANDEAPVIAANEALAVPVEVPTVAVDRQALLAEPAAAGTSPWLWPLWLLNLPFAWIGDNARRAFGLIGIVTLVPATAALVYVIWLKRHWGG